jgi:hypothetical protein
MTDTFGLNIPGIRRADFTRHQASEIERQISTRVGSKERLVAMGVLPDVASEIASAINAAKERAHLAMWV